MGTDEKLMGAVEVLIPRGYHGHVHFIVKGPDNPTNQLLPMITSRCENEMGKAGRKGDGARQVG